MDLSDRQKDLLKAIVELHVKTGEAVGSETVEKQHSLGVSPATIRNEMVKLTEMGYLKQPHTSAGRVPTSIGYRIYIHELMKEKELPVSAEVQMKQLLWQRRHKETQLLREAVRGLASRCQMLALAVSDEDELFYAGASYILDFPEFEDIDVTRFVLSLFDEYPTLQAILGKAVGVEPIHILFGEELGIENLISTSFVFCKFKGRSEVQGKNGMVGVIGPARMNFPMVFPYVKYTASVVEQALRSY
jgi:transcriptional regulator of heat shock response